MFPSAGDELRIKPGGILIAVVAFVLTRTLLVGVIYNGSNPSIVATILRLVPLIIGLGLVIYGVNLAVSTRDRTYARTVATWFLVGSFGIFAMVGLGAIEPSNLLSTFSSNTVIANAVLGGGAGGILVGIRSARDQQRQESLSRQSDQIVLLNGLLRHEILNAITAIRGHAELLSNGNSTDRSFEAVRNGTDRIEQTVNQVGFLVRTVGETAGTLTSVDLAAIAQESSRQFPDDAKVSLEGPPSVQVRADEYLETVMTELISAALERTSEGRASVTINPKETVVDVSVSAPGQWLSEAAREVLLEGLPEHENQNLDYDIPIIKLLVAQYGGSIDIVQGETSTRVVVTLLRTSEQAPESDRPGVSGESLRNAAIAGIVDGVAMGLILQLVAGEMGIIGALYGVQTIAVGWVTHLFHSVVFATVFVAAVTVDSLEQYTESVAGSITLGVVYGSFLWLVAAGVVMGLWLNLVGIPAAIPNLGIVSLIGHTVWGALVGMLVAVLPTEVN
jgi:signal transduction histidine kinase